MGARWPPTSNPIVYSITLLEVERRYSIAWAVKRKMTLQKVLLHIQARDLSHCLIEIPVLTMSSRKFLTKTKIRISSTRSKSTRSSLQILTRQMRSFSSQKKLEQRLDQIIVILARRILAAQKLYSVIFAGQEPAKFVCTNKGHSTVTSQILSPKM